MRIHSDDERSSGSTVSTEDNGVDTFPVIFLGHLNQHQLPVALLRRKLLKYASARSRLVSVEATATTATCSDHPGGHLRFLKKAHLRRRHHRHHLFRRRELNQRHSHFPPRRSLRVHCTEARELGKSNALILRRRIHRVPRLMRAICIELAALFNGVIFFSAMVEQGTVCDSTGLVANPPERVNHSRRMHTPVTMFSYEIERHQAGDLTAVDEVHIKLFRITKASNNLFRRGILRR